MISLPGAVGFSPNKQSSLLPHSQGYCLAVGGEGVQNLSEPQCLGHWARPGDRKGKDEQISHIRHSLLEDGGSILCKTQNNHPQQVHTRHSSQHFIQINSIFTITLWSRYTYCSHFTDKEMKHREVKQYVIHFCISAKMFSVTFSFPGNPCNPWCSYKLEL